VLTLEEALEQIPGATARLPGMAAIFVELGLYGCKDVWIDQSRHPMRIQSSLGTSESEAARRGCNGLPAVSVISGAGGPAAFYQRLPGPCKPDFSASPKPHYDPTPYGRCG